MFQPKAARRKISKILSALNPGNALDSIRSAHLPGSVQGSHPIPPPPKHIPQLPIELWARVIEFIHNTATTRFYPLLLVNWTFHGEAARVLYRNINRSAVFKVSGEKRIDLFRLLAEQPRYAQLVDSFDILWDTFLSYFPIKESRTAINHSLRSMINLRFLTINARDKEAKVVDIGFLLEGCSFRLHGLALSGMRGQDISSLEPYVTELHELRITGSDNHGFEGSKFPALRVMNLEDSQWDRPLLNHLKGCEVRALRLLPTRSIQLAGDPYLPLRSLVIFVNYDVSIVESVFRAFPSLRYLGLSFLFEAAEPLDHLSAYLRGQRHLKFLRIEHPALTTLHSIHESIVEQNVLQKKIAQETILAAPSLLCVSIDGFGPQWRGERLVEETYPGEKWKDEIWWN